VQLRDDVRHGESLAGAGDAEQHLLAAPRVQPVDELLDRLRLIALRREISDQLEDALASHPMLIAKRPRDGDRDAGLNSSAFNVETVVTRGEPTNVEFTADKAGIFPITCQLHPAHNWGRTGRLGEVDFRRACRKHRVRGPTPLNVEQYHLPRHLHPAEAQPGDGDGQVEASRTGAAGIHVQHAVTLCDPGTMGVARDHGGEAGGRRVEIQVVEIVQNIQPRLVHLHRCRVGERRQCLRPNETVRVGENTDHLWLPRRARTPHATRLRDCLDLDRNAGHVRRIG
jgi:hypothetical protein